MHELNKKPLALQDAQQSAWQIAAIQLSGWTSIPILATSILILQGNNFLGSFLTIVLGNAIVWFMRIGIISMSFEKRLSTLDLSRDYLGNVGKHFIAILLLTSTVSWFIMQTTSGSNAIANLLPLNENPNVDQFLQVSVIFGIVSTLLCMGGMETLRKVSTIALPILIIWFLIIFYELPDKVVHSNTSGFSLSGLTLVLATNLGLTADLPTFFRHSNSWRTSVKALIIIQLVSLGLGLGSLYLGSIFYGEFQINSEAVHSTGNAFFRYSIIGFIFLSVVCANVANVYSASVGWELVAPRALVGRKEYFILGLGLTTIFILIGGFFSPKFFLKLSDCSLVNLSIILLLGYVITLRQKRLPDMFQQTTYFISWICSTVVNIFQLSGIIFSEFSTILISLIVVLFIVFSRIIGKKISTTV